MKNFSFIGIIMVTIFAGMFGCTDMGSNVPQPASVPTITAIQPDSAFAGDTLKIIGTNFGATKGSSTVSVGGVVADTVYLWSSTEIDVKVPASAATGSVTVTVGGATSNAPAFKIRGAVAPAVSFANDVLPVFVARGCTGCHGGTNNLFVDTYQHLMLGTSVHGPVVMPGDGEGSVIIKKLRGTAGFGVRMPQGGPYLPDPTIAVISLWITQGALNN
jgi:IPT/TIG domain